MTEYAIQHFEIVKNYNSSKEYSLINMRSKVMTLGLWTFKSPSLIHVSPQFSIFHQTYKIYSDSYIKDFLAKPCNACVSNFIRRKEIWNYSLSIACYKELTTKLRSDVNSINLDIAFQFMTILEYLYDWNALVINY
jgi:hypothetical protein